MHSAPPTSETSAYQAARDFSPARRTLALVTVALAFVMDLLDTTIVNVAIPSIRAGLQASQSHIEWIIAGYAVAFAVLLVVGGRLGDSHGYRRLFLTGVAAFTLASLLCGMAPRAGVLVAARVIQGCSAALMAPQVMALMQVMYPPAQRYRVYAIFGFLGGFSAALGPIIGGLLIDANWFGLGWRTTFLINLPVGLLSWCAGFVLLPQGRAERVMSIDVPGALLSVLWLCAVLIPLIEAPQLGWPLPLCVLLAGTVPLAWGLWRYFLARQRSHADALLPPSLLREPSTALGLVCTLCINPVVPGYLLVMTLVLQDGYGFTPLAMAYACAPIALGAMIAISLIGPRLHRWLGTRVVVCSVLATCAGLLLSAASMRSGGNLSWPLLLAGQLGMGLGLGLAGPPLSHVTLARVALNDAGAASGLLSATQQVAAAVGVALVGLVLFAHAGGSTAMAAARYWATLPVFAGLLLAGLGLSLALPRRVD